MSEIEHHLLICFDYYKAKMDVTEICYIHLIWQREKDSNPHIRSQSPLCYLYTIPLNARAIITEISDLSSINCAFLQFFFKAAAAVT